MSKADNASVRVKELAQEGITIKVMRAHLTIEGFTDKAITKALKDEGITGGAKRGFATDFYDWLAEGARDPDEVKAYIMGDGEYGETTKNIQKHLSHYTNIATMANAIWEAK